MTCVSYSLALPVCRWRLAVIGQRCTVNGLLDLSVQRVLALVTAELLQLQLLRHRFLVLGRRVIPTFALGALQRDDLSSLSRHDVSS